MVEKSRSVGHRLISGTVLQMGNMVASAIAAFFLMPFVVHHLGDRIYGFWSLSSSFIVYYGLLDLGLSTAVSQYISIAIARKDDSECRAVFNTAFRIQLMLGVAAFLATAVLVACTPWFCHNRADVSAFREVIAILGTSAALSFPVRVYGGVLYTQFRFDIQSWLAILGLVLRTGLVVCVIWAGHGLLALAWATLFATLPVSVLQIWYARRESSWARIDIGKIELKRAKSLFSYSIYSFMTSIADMLRFQIDPLVISGLIGLAAVTHYRVASIFAQYFIQILVFSVGMLQPVFSRMHGAGDKAGLERVFFFGTKLSVGLSVFFCFALIGWGKPFLARWMGMRYEDAYLPLVVLSVSVLLDVCQKPQVDLLFATFNHRSYAYLNTAEGLLNLAFSVVLARPLGVLGVALGTLIGAFIIRVVVQPWWVCKVTGYHYAGYMRFLNKNLLYCSAIMGAAMAVVAWGLRPSYVLLISSAICATLLYAIGSWTLVFDEREREQFRAALGRNYVQKLVGPAVVEVPPSPVGKL